MLSTSSYPAIMVAIIKLSTCDVLVLLTFDHGPGIMPLVLVDEVKLKFYVKLGWIIDNNLW